MKRYEKKVRDITLMADEMERNGASPGEIAEAVRSAASDDPDVKAGVLGMAKSYRRQQETLNARAMKAGPANEAMIMEAALGNADWAQITKLIEESGLHFSGEFMSKLNKVMQHKANGTGAFDPHIGNYKEVVQDKLGYSNSDMNKVWLGAKLEASAYRNNYYEEHGYYPSDAEMVDALVDATKKKGVYI